MFTEVRFAFYAIKKNIQSSVELRTSFLMNVFGMMINNTAFIFIWIFFVQSVGVIHGWTAVDIVGLQGFTAITYGTVFSLALGIRKLPEYVSTGAFDRFILSPKNILLRVATSSFSPSAVGDIIFGIISLGMYIVLIHAGLLQVLLGIALIILATVTFLAVTIIIFSTSFFFMDSSNVSNGFFEIFFTPALFHGGAFQGTIRFIYTFLIPSLLIGTLPVEAIHDTSLLKFFLIATATVFWSVLAIFIFNRALRSYESSNFMTFGN